MMESTIESRPGMAGRVPDALIVTPPGGTKQPPIVVVHGIHRDAGTMAEALAAQAAKAGRTLVLPLFDRASWPRYQRAACPSRSDHALLALMEALEAEARILPGPFDLSGFSGGAQFSHRFAWLYPMRVRRLALSSAGWWTFPDDAPFPYGMGPSKEGPPAAPFWLRSNLHAFLDREIVVRVGAEDCFVDRHTRSGPRIDAQQGPNRLMRGRNWVAALRNAAHHHGLPSRVSFAELPGCGHDFAACAGAGLASVFVPSEEAVPVLPRSVA